MVEVMSAPSKDLFRALTLSIYKLISSTFLVDIEGVFSRLFSILTSGSRFRLSAVRPFFIVDLVEAYAGFFLKSILRSFTGAEYFVLTFISFVCRKPVGFFLSDCPDCLLEIKVFFLGSFCGVY